MAVKERRERERLETRAKIMDAARELFVAEGYDGVTMRKVAEKIEYSPTAIYVHFADKEHLFRELCHQDFGVLAQSFQNIAGIADPVERIRQTGRAYAAFGMELPNHYKLLFLSKVLAVEPTSTDSEVGSKPQRDSYGFLVQCVQQAIDAGRFRRDMQDAELIAQTLWAGIHGVISLHIVREREDRWVQWRPIEDRVELMLDVMLRGFLRQGK